MNVSITDHTKTNQTGIRWGLQLDVPSSKNFRRPSCTATMRQNKNTKLMPHPPDDRTV